MTSLAPGPGRKSHLQGQDQLPDFQFHLMPQPPCPCSSSLFPKWSHWSQMVEWALYFNSKRAWKFGDKIAIRRNKWGRGEEKIMREKQAGRGHQRNIAGQQDTWAPLESSHFILSCLRILQHTPVHTCEPKYAVLSYATPAWTKSQGELQYGSYLVSISLHCSPTLAGREPPGMGQGPSLEIRTPDFTACDAHSPWLCCTSVPMSESKLQLFSS